MSLYEHDGEVRLQETSCTLNVTSHQTPMQNYGVLCMNEGGESAEVKTILPKKESLVSHFLSNTTNSSQCKVEFSTQFLTGDVYVKMLVIEVFL